MKKSYSKNEIYCFLTLCMTLYIFNINTLFAKDLQDYSQKVSIVSVERDTNYYVRVDENAGFLKGGINEFNQFLVKKLIYPDNEKINKIEGKVVAQFGVNCFGDIGFVKILRSSGNVNFDNEAIRVIKSSPKWTPAKIGKKFVGQNFMTIVTFKL